jgi:NADH dehydrogenase [ubiquinone] 1 alpha subcomplex assembly factor 1
MQGAERPSRAPLTLFTFHTPEAIKDYALGCDADVGGTSTAHLDFDDDPVPAPAPARLPPSPSPSRSRTGITTTTKTPITDTERSDAAAGTKRGAARFHGHMRLAVGPGYEQRIRGGYAGFRNKVRTALTLTFPFSFHFFLISFSLHMAR